jgi:hypothetical protein
VTTRIDNANKNVISQATSSPPNRRLETDFVLGRATAA